MALSPEDHKEQDTTECACVHMHTHTHHLQCQLLTFAISDIAKRIDDKVSYNTSSVIQNNP